jgi:hypothetical protein
MAGGKVLRGIVLLKEIVVKRRFDFMVSLYWSLLALL